jgi:NADH-quinone oxidoreductase subunit C
MEIAHRLEKAFSGHVIDVDSFHDQVSVRVVPSRILAICSFLHSDPEIRMDYLADLCGVDYPDREPRFEVVYNLYSLEHRHGIRVKAGLPAGEPSIDSVVSVWKGANWFEREAYDLYGIVFRDHPDLRRLLMTENWEGYPLRKDYPLTGPDDWEFPEFQDAMELHERDDEWTVR